MGLEGKLIRVGDLCKYTIGYDNGRSVNIWCKLISIKDHLGKLHNSYNVITGRGDLNSKITLDIKALSYCKDLSNYHEIYGDLNDKVILDLDPHKVVFHYDYWIKETEDKIEFLNKQKEFLLKNRNILDKINEIL